jgi:hypothetical protein
MIPALLVAMAAGAVLIWVLQPLGGKRRSAFDETGVLIEEAGARKRAALEAIIDMENERASGKLSEAGFEALRGQYEVEAVRALKEIDALSGQLEGDDAVLESEIARMRAGLTCPRCGAWKTGETCERCHESST